MDQKFLPLTSHQLQNLVSRIDLSKNKYREHNDLISRAEANGIIKNCHNIYLSIDSINIKDINDGNISKFDALRKTPEYLSTTQQKKSEHYQYLQFMRLRSAWVYMNTLCIPFDKNGAPRHPTSSEIQTRSDLWGYVQTSFRTLRVIEFQNGYFESCSGTWLFFESGGKNDCYSKGLRLMDKGVKMESNNPMCRKNMGDAYLCSVTPFYNIDKAEYNFKKALQLYPDYSNAIYQLINLYHIKKSWNEANSMIEKYYSAVPKAHTELWSFKYLKSKISNRT